MVRLFLLLILCATLAAIVMLVASVWTNLFTAGTRRLRPVLSQSKDADMASSGIQKAAYIALIIVLFGAASGWLGGL